MGNTTGSSALRFDVVPDDRIKEALRQAKSQHAELPSLDRVLLNFPKIKRTFRQLHAAFREFVGSTSDGTLSHEELGKLLVRLGAKQLGEKDVDAIFQQADVYNGGRLTYAEFVVCLCLGYVLRAIPLLSPDPTSRPLTGDVVEVRLQRSASQFCRGDEVQQSFEFAVQCYLLFDPEATGIISRHNMDRAIVALQQHSPSKRLRKNMEGGWGSRAGSLLAECRWSELFLNGGETLATCSFPRFIFAFVGWVSCQEEDDGECDE